MSLQLLFECISEEIPPRMQDPVTAQIKNYIAIAFNKNNLKFKSIKVFITARRIALFVDDINISEFIVSNNKIKGPSVHAPKIAIEGFLRKNEKNQEDLFIQRINNTDFYFIKRNTHKSNIKEFLKNLLEEMLKNLSWKRSMRWSERKERWIRPIKSILCILNDEIIPVSFSGITAKNFTYGHRFLSNGKTLTIKSPHDYFILLKKNSVIIQPNKRKNFILKQIDKFVKKNKLQFKKNDSILNELTGLVEWPTVLFGKVDQEKSSQLPNKILLSVINTKQKYLALSKGERISHFCTVVNVCNNEVINGYEKIMKARLDDVIFLISQDKKENLDFYVKKLDSMLFHGSLGSFGKKVKRIVALSKYIAVYVPHASLIKVERAAYLAKADLATSLVKEFPELQGAIGAYYASYFHEDKEIVEAIIEHYNPIGLECACPKSPVAIAVAIADKMDSLVGLISTGEKISGSYDQFGLRRMSIGIIKIILQNNLHIPIRLLINQSISLYQKYTPIENIKPFDMSDKFPGKEKILELVLNFFLERFKIILKDMGIRQDAINSILCRTNVNDILTSKKEIIVLNRYLDTPESEHVLSAYKRVSNIINKAEKKDHTTYRASYSEKLLTNNEEIMLSNYTLSFYKKITEITPDSYCFNAILDKLTGFASIIDLFMENVKINCNSDKLRKNRLHLLAKVISTFHLVADFSLIQIKNDKL